MLIYINSSSKTLTLIQNKQPIKIYKLRSDKSSFLPPKHGLYRVSFSQSAQPATESTLPQPKKSKKNSFLNAKLITQHTELPNAAQLCLHAFNSKAWASTLEAPSYYTNEQDWQELSSLLNETTMLYVSSHEFHTPTQQEESLSSDRLSPPNEVKAYTSTLLYISASQQTLTHIANNKAIKEYPIATGLFGLGQRSGSYQTPLGLHQVSEIIGKDQPMDTFYKARIPQGSYRNPPAGWKDEKDWILSRIIRLAGCETGFNQGCDTDGELVDTHDRYIYIHGTPLEQFVQAPSSHGCIRMRPTDIRELFEELNTNTWVYIR